MTIDCTWLRQNLAYDCRPVRTVNGDAACEIGTPFSFADGTAIVFYIVDQGTHALLSDNGDTLAHLRSVGLDPFKREAAIRSMLQPFGIALESNGEIRALGPKDTTAHIVAAYISGLLAVATQERAWLCVPESVNDLADQVEHYLRLWRPADKLVRHPRLIGISRHEHTFDFMLGSELVDVISPSHQATGGLMRKVGDILSAADSPPRIRVIIDDRLNFERAETERQIIGSMACAMLFSRLKGLAGKPSMH